MYIGLGVASLLTLTPTNPTMMRDADLSETEMTSFRLVHLDLKGAPPRLSYLLRLLPLLKDWGAEGVLIEYEDTFPYHGPLASLATENAYSLDDLSRLVAACSNLDMMIVPLVQTFGHMEFVLKHAEFAHLREAADYPNSICPSKTDSQSLIQLMLDQILDFHTDCQIVHIGCDEVRNLGDCADCLERMRREKLTNERLFCEHVMAVANHVAARRPGVRVLFWDDMLRSIGAQRLVNSNLAKSPLEPVVWFYGANGIPDVLARYGCVFSRVWCASAFKGASGPAECTPDIALHVDNHKLWLAAVNDKRNETKFGGFILTGWTRYDHYGVLCELLPAAIPSLCLCLHILKHEGFNEFSHDQASKAVGLLATERICLVQRPRPQPIQNGLDFPGSEIYCLAHLQANLSADFNSLRRGDFFQGWFHVVNLARNFFNPGYLKQFSSDINVLAVEFEKLRDSARTELPTVFADCVCLEWERTHIEHYLDRLSKTRQKLARSLNRSTEIGL